MSEVGRNDPCPCGSGKKYKRCHLPLDAAGNSADAVDQTIGLRAALAELEGEDERYWGRDSRDHMVCMVYQAVPEHLADLERQARRPLSGGDWLISTGEHEATVIHGPFPELDDAFDYAHTQLGAVRFVSGLEIG